MRADLNGKVALVTGAANGIGREIATVLARNGAAIVIADIDVENAASLANERPIALSVRMDVCSEESVGGAVAAALERFGRIDILVNNAGVNTLEHRVEIERFPVNEWHRILRVDLDGPFLVSRAVLPCMLAAGCGRIVNIASTVGIAALRLQSPFVAAKAGIIHLTRSMALELGHRGILVNAVAPGSTLTDVTRKLFYAEDGSFHARAARLMEHIPLGRPGRPEEIAQAVLFLASPASSYVNGHILTVDGGWTAGAMM